MRKATEKAEKFPQSLGTRAFEPVTAQHMVTVDVGGTGSLVTLW